MKNRETLLLLSLLQADLNDSKISSSHKKEIQRLIEYFNVCEVDSNFSSESVHPLLWSKLVNFYNDLESTRALVDSFSHDKPSVQTITDITPIINYERLFDVDFYKEIDKFIADIINSMSRIKLFNAAMKKYNAIKVKNSVQVSEDFIREHQNTFNDLFLVLQTQEHLIQHIFQNAI